MINHSLLAGLDARPRSGSVCGSRPGTWVDAGKQIDAREPMCASIWTYGDATGAFPLVLRA